MALRGIFCSSQRDLIFLKDKYNLAKCNLNAFCSLDSDSWLQMRLNSDIEIICYKYPSVDHSVNLNFPLI